MAPKDVHPLILETCEYAIPHDKTVIKLKILK